MVAPVAFRIAFGENWTTSGTYARPLALALAAQMVASPLSQTLIALEKTVAQLCWDIGRLTIVGAATLTSILLGAPALVTLWVLSGALTLSYVASWLLSRHYLRSSRPLARVDLSDKAPAAVAE